MLRYPEISIGGGETAAPLNLARRVALLRRQVALEGAKVIDCGCGRGDYVAALRPMCGFVTGVEFNVAKIETATSSGLVRGDVEHLGLRGDAFDVALLNEVLEHVPDDAACLRDVYRVLRAGGDLVVFSPNRLYPFETHGTTTRFGRELPLWVPFIPYVPLRVGRKVFRYRARNYWRRDLRRLLEEAGFEVRWHGTIWQTFENISSGLSGGAWRRMRPLLRWVSLALERVPLLRRFGVSQVVIACKPKISRRGRTTG